MRVCTFNIHGGTDVARRPSLPAIADVLASVNADVVLLQECDRFLPRSGFQDQAQWLARHLDYPVCHFHGRLGAGPVSFGNAVLTRRVISRRLRVDLPGGGEPRGAAGIVLSDGTTLFCVHLGLRDTWRASQLEALATAVTERPADAPVLVGGDFNAAPDAPEVVAFIERAGLTDLCDPATAAMTFPAGAPTHRIDLLLARGGIEAANYGIQDAPAASDHCLIWVDLAKERQLSSASGTGLPSNRESSPSNSSAE